MDCRSSRRRDSAELNREGWYNDQKPERSQNVCIVKQGGDSTYGSASRASASSCNWLSMNLEDHISQTQNLGSLQESCNRYQDCRLTLRQFATLRRGPHYEVGRHLRAARYELEFAKELPCLDLLI